MSVMLEFELLKSLYNFVKLSDILLTAGILLLLLPSDNIKFFCKLSLSLIRYFKIFFYTNYMINSRIFKYPSNLF